MPTLPITPVLTPAQAGPAHAQAPAVRRYYPQLDGVRAIAVAMVMFFHLAQEGPHIPGPIIIGQTGVDLFFVLSGFLITGILLKSRQGDWHAVRTFYARRTLRIFPLYYVYLIICVLVGQQISPCFWVYLQNIFLAVGAPAFGPLHFWSLAVEEQFYLVWPFVVLFLPRKHLVKVLWLVVAAAFLSRFALLHWHFSLFYFTFSRVDALAAGALLAVVEQSNRMHRMRRLLMVVCGIAAVALVIEGKAAVGHPGLAWLEVTKYTALAAFYTAGIGILLTNKPGVLSRLLGSAPMRFVGRISYGLYVFHPAVFAFCFARMAKAPGIVQALVGVTATFACALVSWYAMERPLTLLKDKLAPEPVRFPPSAPPAAAL